jgi:hypothetical protein
MSDVRLLHHHLLDAQHAALDVEREQERLRQKRPLRVARRLPALVVRQQLGVAHAVDCRVVERGARHQRVLLVERKQLGEQPRANDRFALVARRVVAQQAFVVRAQRAERAAKRRALLARRHRCPATRARAPRSRRDRRVVARRRASISSHS